MRKRMKSNNIKYQRNPIFYLCAILLCLTLITTCLLCGLLAKYRATGSGDDGAHVAEFGQLTLTETTGNIYQVVPGVNITKDPTVTMSASEVAVSVYVDITLLKNYWTMATETGTGDNVIYTFSYMVDNGNDSEDESKLAFLSWTVADGWTYSGEVTDVNQTAGSNNTVTYSFVRKLAAGETLADQKVIEGDTITVSKEIYYDVYYDTVTAALDALDITISARVEQID